MTLSSEQRDPVRIQRKRTKGWKMPEGAVLGKGWPDLILVRGLQIMAVELKAEGGKPTPEQLEVLHVLDEAGIDTAIWKPSHFDEIQAALEARTTLCRVYWGSHGCDRPRGHDGPHQCDSCWDPEDTDGYVGAWPYYGPETNFYGEDAPPARAALAKGKP